MPIKVPDRLPAKEILRGENIFVMAETRAFQQDIRPLEIAIVNLMPLKEVTEVQLLRLLGNSPLQINITFLHMESHISKNTPAAHLADFYKVFGEVRHSRFDGMIITGAPVETLPYEQVSYWRELSDIMRWSRANVTSVLHLCWGAFAGLYEHYGIDKFPLSRKMFGIFPHTKTSVKLAENSHAKNSPAGNPSADYPLEDNPPEKIELLRGFDDVFYAPHSRHVEIREQDILTHPDLVLLAASEEAGVYLAASKDCRRQIFVTGHSEYDPLTLDTEYRRDIARELPIHVPLNYYPGGDPAKPPVVNWRSHANLLFSNWLNYCVYQETPYEL